MAEPARIQSIPIPEDLRSLLLSKVSEKDLPAWGIEALVVEAAREHIISRRRAAELLELNDYESREDFFERHGLTNEYTLDMVELDFKTMEALKQSR